MPVQLIGYASVEPIAVDKSASSWKSPVDEQQDKAIRSLARAYERSCGEEPRAASLIKAQWAAALLPGRLHACRPPKQVTAKLAVAELVGVYFGLYCNPLRDSVHKRLNRTLADILREAPADGGSLLARTLKELLNLQRPGGNLGQRAAIWGTKQDMTDLLIFLQQSSCGGVDEVQAMRQECAQTGLDALLAHARDTLHQASPIDLQNWPVNALTLIENEAVLKNHEQLDTLALLAMLGHETRLMERLPAAAFAARRLFACHKEKLTLVQWLLGPRDIFEQTKKLQFVLEHSVDPLWYPKGDVSPWLQSLRKDPSAKVALDMLEVVGPYHRDCRTGATPLHLMAYIPDNSGAWSMLSALLIQGADPYARDDQGATALTYLAGSPYARAVQVFPAWYKKIGPWVDKFCESTETPPHAVVALLLPHDASLGEAAAARMLAACCDVYDVDKRELDAEDKIAFVRAASNWICSRVGSEQQESLATLECMPSVAVGKKVFGCMQEPRGSEWRILRMLLVHMRACKPQGCNPLMAVEVMDDICRARKIGVEHLVHAVSDFRALPLTWFSDQTWPRPPAYKTLLNMFNLNAQFPDQRVSSAIARQVRKMRMRKLMDSPMSPQIMDEDITKLVMDVRHAAQEHTDAAAGSGFMSRMFEAMDIFNSLNCSPLFDDDWTAQAIAYEASPQDAGPCAPAVAPGATRPPPAGHLPPPAAAASTVSEPTEPGSAPTRDVPATSDLAAPAANNALLPVIAQGIDPLVRDLQAKRLAENHLQPLRALAEAVCACPTLLRGRVPLFDQAIESLQAAHDAVDDAAEQTAKDLRKHVALISGALHNEVLQGVILGTAGIGESVPMQRATKRLVTRAFVQVLACALGADFALVYLSADEQARSAALRKLMFRVAPDRFHRSRNQPEIMHAIKELFQLVSGLKTLREREEQRQLERSVAATLARPGAR